MMVQRLAAEVLQSGGPAPCLANASRAAISGNVQRTKCDVRKTFCRLLDADRSPSWLRFSPDQP
jgi:hypothetical protein